MVLCKVLAYGQSAIALDLLRNKCHNDFQSSGIRHMQYGHKCGIYMADIGSMALNALPSRNEELTNKFLFTDIYPYRNTQ